MCDSTRDSSCSYSSRSSPLKCQAPEEAHLTTSGLQAIKWPTVEGMEEIVGSRGGGHFE